MLPANVAARPDFFADLLERAAEARLESESPRIVVVVVVGGLDDADTPRKQNVLGLPRHQRGRT